MFLEIGSRAKRSHVYKASDPFQEIDCLALMAAQGGGRDKAVRKDSFNGLFGKYDNLLMVNHSPDNTTSLSYFPVTSNGKHHNRMTLYVLFDVRVFL